MSAEEPLKKMEGPITVEQAFNVDGKRLLVKVTFPGNLAKDVGMETVYAVASKALVNIESKTHRVEKPR